MSAILPRPILPRFARASFPFPSPSDACKAGYLLHDCTLFVIGQKPSRGHGSTLLEQSHARAEPLATLLHKFFRAWHQPRVLPWSFH